MKIAKNRFSIIVFLIVMAMLSSCSPDAVTDSPDWNVEDHDGGTEVSFVLSEAEEKILAANVITETAYYTYTAVPLFDLEEPNVIYGVRENEYNIGADGTINLGYFTAGRWTFHVYAYNRINQLLREGETTLYLKKTASGITNTVPVTLYRSVSRTGKAEFIIDSNTLSTNGSRIGISWSYNQAAFTNEIIKTPTVINNANNTASYDFFLENMQSGTYTFRLSLYDGTVRVGGMTLSTYILGTRNNDLTTVVNGTLYPADYLSTGFSIIIPPSIAGELNETYITTSVGTNHTFEWGGTSGTPVTYIWYKDGVEQARTTNGRWSYTPNIAGVFTISCVALSASGLESGSAACTLYVGTGQRQTFSASWTSPSTAQTVQYVGTARQSSLVRVLVSRGYDSVYSGYLILSETSSGSGIWTSAITVEGKTVTFRLANGVLTMTPSAALTGLTVVVDGRI